MGIYALMFALFTSNGSALIDGQLFKTQAACETVLKEVPAFIAEHNASAENPVKITHYTAVCTELQKVPQGEAI